MASAIAILEKEYEQKQMENSKERELKIQNAYSVSPRIKEIDLKINSLGIKCAKLSISSSSQDHKKERDKLFSEIKKLKSEKDKLLKENSLSIEPTYDCPICKDTGYITENGHTTMCSCMKQKLIDIRYNKLNSFRQDKENFDNFDYNLYSNESNLELYGTKKSPRENIKQIVKVSQEFINNFKDENTKNLLFYGKSGTGKTFLSGCIANEFIKNGYSVVYQTAPLLLDIIFDYKYNSTPKNKELYENLYNVDLLIIDDLGTENQTPAKFAELFSLINSRIVNPNTKTIISSNFDLDKLNQKYDDRLISRFIGNYIILRFIGEDIRMK